MQRFFFLMQGGNRIGDEVHVHDVDLVLRPEGQHRQAGQEHERLYHVELRGFGIAAVAQNDAGTEDRDSALRGEAAASCAR